MPALRIRVRPAGSAHSPTPLPHVPPAAPPRHVLCPAPTHPGPQSVSQQKLPKSGPAWVGAPPSSSRASGVGLLPLTCDPPEYRPELGSASWEAGARPTGSLTREGLAGEGLPREGGNRTLEW